MGVFWSRSQRRHRRRLDLDQKLVALDISIFQLSQYVQVLTLEIAHLKKILKKEMEEMDPDASLSQFEEQCSWPLSRLDHCEAQKRYAVRNMKHMQLTLDSIRRTQEQEKSHVVLSKAVKTANRVLGVPNQTFKTSFEQEMDWLADKLEENEAACDIFEQMPPNPATRTENSFAKELFMARNQQETQSSAKASALVTEEQLTRQEAFPTVPKSRQPSDRVSLQETKKDGKALSYVVQ